LTASAYSVMARSGHRLLARWSAAGTGRRPARHLQPARQHTVSAAAPLHAGLHDMPQIAEGRLDLRLCGRGPSRWPA
jgi:hypothetical protein